MDPNAPPPPDAESLIRAALGEWASRVPGAPVEDFGRKIALVSVRDLTVHTGFLRGLYDARTGPVDKLLPFRADAPLPVAAKKDPWSLPVRLSRQFLEQEETVVGAEAAEPMECGRCAGENEGASCETCKGAKAVPCAACSSGGRKSCPSCAGRGKIACALCAGSGRVLQSLSADGMRIEDTCPQCTGKKALPCHECSDATASDCTLCGNKRSVTCPACKGRGAAACVQCGGSRKVIQAFSYAVAYTIAYFRSVVRDPAVPAEVFPEDPPSGKLGRTVCEFEGDGPEAFAGRAPDGAPGEAFARVLRQLPEGGLGEKSRLILCAIAVESTPTYEVVYSFEGKEYGAWVGGYGNRVVAKGDPFADLAGRQAAEAQARLETGDLAGFEELTARATASAPLHPAVAALRGKAAAVVKPAVISLGVKVAIAAAIVVPSILCILYKSPSRFVPLAALGLAILGAALGAAFRLASWLAARPLQPPAVRTTWTVSAAAAAAAVPLLLFLLVGPIRRMDAAQFAAGLAHFDSLDFAQWSADDPPALAALDKDYSARGVDTSAGKALLEQYETYQEAARAKAALAERQRLAAEAAARAKADAAKKAAARWAKEDAARKAAAKKAAAKKKKKKK